MSLLLTFGKKSVIQRAISVLRKFGSDAHAYIPGVGVLNGMTAGNYTDTAGTQAAIKDAPIGKATDAIDGIHATQGTAGNKPVLRQGLTNLLTYSSDFSNAAWAKTAIPTPTTGIADPWGGNTAQKIVATAVSTNHFLSYTSGGLPSVGTTCTYAVIARADGESVLGLSIAGGTTFAAAFNLATGVATANGTTAEMKPLGGGWYLCVMVATPTAYGHTPYITIRQTQAAFVGDGVSGLNLAGAGLFSGTLTANQILTAGGIPLTTSAKASAGTGPSYWEFGGDGTPTDYLSLGSVPYQMSDDFVVVVASRLSYAPGGSNAPYVFANKANSFVSVGSITYSAAGNPNAHFYDGTTTASITHAASVLTPAVISCRKVGNEKILRVNGAQSGAANTAAMSNVVPTNSYIGASGGSVAAALSAIFYFPGDVYCIFVIKGTVSDADLLLIEKLAANLAGVTL